MHVARQHRGRVVTLLWPARGACAALALIVFKACPVCLSSWPSWINAMLGPRPTSLHTGGTKVEEDDESCCTAVL